jgi:RNA polymerase sigma-70 factor (ECF subfamily)
VAETKETMEFLARQAIGGNEECFVSLCDLLKHKLFRTAKGILGNESLALDAVSEAIFRGFKGIKRLREPKFVETWFIRIIINVAKNFYRRQKHEISMKKIPEGIYHENHNEMEFNQMIESLQPDLREIISLKYYSDYTLGEIAEILKIPEGTVKSRLNRALNILRLEVKNE